MYPGQAYFHRHNPNIRRAEENWMVAHGHDLAVEQPVIFLEAPQIPQEVFDWLDWVYYKFVFSVTSAQGLNMAGKEPKVKVAAQPEAGTRGTKTNDCDATLRKGNMPKASTVTTVSPDANKGLTVKLASANVDGNPKKRTCNSWGIKTPDCK